MELLMRRSQPGAVRDFSFVFDDDDDVDHSPPRDVEKSPFHL